MKRVSLADRPELASLIERMRESVVLTGDEGPVAVVLTPEDYQAMRAAADLAEDPRRLADIVRAHDRFQAGESHEAEDWRAAFK